MFYSDYQPTRMPVGVHAFALSPNGYRRLFVNHTLLLIMEAAVICYRKLGGKFTLRTTAPGYAYLKKEAPRLVSLYSDVTLLQGRCTERPLLGRYTRAVQLEALATIEEPCVIMDLDAIVRAAVWEKGDGATMPLTLGRIIGTADLHLDFLRVWGIIHRAPYIDEMLAEYFDDGIDATVANPSICYFPDPAIARLFGDLGLRWLERFAVVSAHETGRSSLVTAANRYAFGTLLPALVQGADQRIEAICDANTVNAHPLNTGALFHTTSRNRFIDDTLDRKALLAYLINPGL